MTDFVLPPSQTALRRIPFACLEPGLPKQRLSSESQQVLVELLDATIPIARRGDSLFKPIWVHEAMHRSILIARIILLGERLAGNAGAGWDMTLVRDITSIFRELAEPDDRKLTLIRDVLFNLTSDLASLFRIRKIEFSSVNIVIPAYRRRAVVLAATSLMLSWILFIYQNDVEGEICLTLSHDDLGFLQLRTSGTPALPDSAFDRRVIADLANVLNGRLVERNDKVHENFMEISFPPFS